MRLLLDTHCFIWLFANSAKLSKRVLALVENPQNNLLLSAASAWEVALLWNLKRISLPDHPSRFVPEVAQKLCLDHIPISASTAIQAATLPMHHRDPFDRLLVATAQIQGVAILSKDPLVHQYEVESIWT